jgi:hypothetical protein
MPSTTSASRRPKTARRRLGAHAGRDDEPDAVAVRHVRALVGDVAAVGDDDVVLDRRVHLVDRHGLARERGLVDA